MAAYSESRLRPFTLGRWQVRPDESRVIAGSDERRLSPRAMDVLCLLARGEGRTVPKERLFKEVWHDAAVTDDVLNVAVSSLRRALDDNARSPVYIETIPKRGYRLLLKPTAAKEDSLRNWICRPRTAGLLVVASLAVVILGLSIFPRGRRQATEISGTSTQPSIVVLPFSNFSDQDRQFLADGLTEAVTTRLAKTGRLSVVSRTTAQRFSGTTRSVREIGEELGVDLVLEGSVQLSGERLILHAQLIDAATDRHLWADEYDRTQRDLLEIQFEVANAVVKLVGGGEDHDPPPSEVAPEAFERYLHARYLRHQGSRESLDQAREKLSTVIRESPRFALGHAALAEALLLSGERGWMPADEASSRARLHAARALVLDPGLAEAHAVLAVAAFVHDWDFHQAGRSFAKAMQANPSDVATLRWYVQFLVASGEQEQALVTTRRIERLDPDSWTSLLHITTLACAGAYEAAVERLARLEQRMAPDAATLFAKAFVLGQMARHDEAAETYLAFAELAGLPLPVAELRALLGRDGARAVYAHLAGYTGPLSTPTFRARFYSLLGRTDDALDQLDQAIRGRDMSVLWISVDRAFVNLRTRPRFQDLVKATRLGLPPKTTG